MVEDLLAAEREEKVRFDVSVSGDGDRMMKRQQNRQESVSSSLLSSTASPFLHCTASQAYCRLSSTQRKVARATLSFVGRVPTRPFFQFLNPNQRGGESRHKI